MNRGERLWHNDSASEIQFLTDRETAEVTALTTLGPLALMAFEAQPFLGVTTVPEAEIAPQAEQPGVANTVELNPELYGRQHMAQAAIAFASQHEFDMVA